MMQPLTVHVGQRNVKTALSASLCALIYYFLGRNPAFACIGAIFGMGANMDHSKLHGGNRLFGTIIGGLLGMGLFRIYLIFYPDGENRLLLVPLLFVGVIILILLAWTCVELYRGNKRFAAEGRGFGQQEKEMEDSAKN